MRRTVPLPLAFMFLAVSSLSAQEKAEEIVAKIRQTYEKLESLKGDFEQQYTWSLAGETQVLNGTLYLKKGDRYRVETSNQMIITDGKTVWTYSLDKKQVFVDHLEKSKENPLPRDLMLNGTLYLKKGDRYRVETPNQVIITDGKTVWTYSLDKKQVFVDRLEKSKENPLPRDLMLKYTRDYKPRLLRSEKVGGSDCHVIALTPRDEDAFVQLVTAWIDKSTGLALRIEQTDLNDNKTVYLLKNAQRNVPLAEELFSFKIPADVEVVDMR